MRWVSNINKSSILVLLGVIILFCSSCHTIPGTYYYTVDLRGTFVGDESHIVVVSQRSGRGKIELHMTGPELPNPVILSNDVAFWCKPAFNSQTNSVIFYSGDKSKIYSCSLNDYSISEIAEPIGNFYYLHISEDGNTILDDRAIRKENPLLRIYRLDDDIYKEYNDSDIGKEIELVSISPDGSLIVYHSNNNLYLLNIETDGIECLTTNLFDVTMAEWQTFPLELPAFTSDSSEIAFYREQVIYFMELSTKKVARKLELKRFGDFAIHFMQFSSDNRHLLFEILHRKPDIRSGIYTYNFDTQAVRRIYDNTKFKTLSPDGKKVMVLGGPPGNKGLYLMGINGKNIIRISPDW